MRSAMRRWPSSNAIGSPSTPGNIRSTCARFEGEIVKKLSALILALLFLPLAAQAQTADTVKLLINPALIFDLPLMVAIDKGYFTQQNLDVKAIVHSGSSQVIIPEIV